MTAARLAGRTRYAVELARAKLEPQVAACTWARLLPLLEDARAAMALHAKGTASADDTQLRLRALAAAALMLPVSSASVSTAAAAAESKAAASSSRCDFTVTVAIGTGSAGSAGSAPDAAAAFSGSAKSSGDDGVDLLRALVECDQAVLERTKGVAAALAVRDLATLAAVLARRSLSPSGAASSQQPESKASASQTLEPAASAPQTIGFAAACRRWHELLLTEAQAVRSCLALIFSILMCCPGT